MDITCPEPSKSHSLAPVSEQDNKLNASFQPTHEELAPQQILSLIANLTPWSDYNQSPRNMYQCQMGKQTMAHPLHALRCGVATMGSSRPYESRRVL